jgi:hypothetical protein
MPAFSIIAVPALHAALGVGDVVVAQHLVQGVEHRHFLLLQLAVGDLQHLVVLALEHMVVRALAFLEAALEAR